MEFVITALESIALYVLIIICFRLIGKKGLSDLSIVDLILVILIGESLGSLIPPSNPFINAASCIIALVLVNYGLEHLTFKYKKFKDLLEGVPVTLIENSLINYENLKKEKLTIDEIHVAMRSSGTDDLNDVKLATLETDGKITIVLKKLDSK